MSMATGSDVEAQELDQVRIPAKLLAKLDELLSAVTREVIKQSCQRALARSGGDKACIVNKDDVVASARAALTEAMSELDTALTPGEPYHVRRAS
jgi:hypothetical protein